jgi:hypothetical protein
MFIFEWIEHYINTLDIQRTIADEVLFLAAICIILIAIFAVLGIVGFIAKKIYDFIKMR